MAWVRIDDNAPHHRKMLQAGPVACWLWVCGLAYCQRVRTDGFIPAEALPSLGVSSWKKPVASLLASGLWHKDEGGYRVHDYLSWNATKEERADRAQAHRERTAKWREQQRDASQKKERDESVTRHTESSVTLLPSSPLHSTPKEEVPLKPSTTTSNPSERSSSPLVLGPARFEKLKQSHAFVGSRLRVPNVLHEELRTKLGGHNAENRLQVWYLRLNTDAEESAEPIVDVFTWLRPKFIEWAEEAAYQEALAKVRP